MEKTVQERTVSTDSIIKVKTDKAKTDKGKTDRPLKFTFKEQKEYERIDEIISDLEKELAEVNKGITDAASDYERLQKLLSMQEDLEAQLNKAMERWVYLNELAESISRNSLH